MAWRIVLQPNGKYARWSDVVDDFTDKDMTRAEAYELCLQAAGAEIAKYKIEQADKHPGRFDREIETILEVHGKAAAKRVRKELSAEMRDPRTVAALDDPDEYRRVMTYPLTFEIRARTDNYEEYEMTIVAKSDEQAGHAAAVLCETLGLILLSVLEKE